MERRKNLVLILVALVAILMVAKGVWNKVNEQFSSTTPVLGDNLAALDVSALTGHPITWIVVGVLVLAVAWRAKQLQALLTALVVGFLGYLLAGFAGFALVTWFDSSWSELAFGQYLNQEFGDKTAEQLPVYIGLLVGVLTLAGGIKATKAKEDRPRGSGVSVGDQVFTSSIGLAFLVAVSTVSIAVLLLTGWLTWGNEVERVTQALAGNPVCTTQEDLQGVRIDAHGRLIVLCPKEVGTLRILSVSGMGLTFELGEDFAEKYRDVLQYAKAGTFARLERTYATVNSWKLEPVRFVEQPELEYQASPFEQRGLDHVVFHVRAVK